MKKKSIITESHNKRSTLHSMFHIRNIRSFTKSANPGNINNALMLVKHQLRSSYHHDNNNNNNAHDDDDMANMATARRFIDDYMRRIQKGDDDSCSGNLKCEITKKLKRKGQVDCNCNFVCMAKISETMLIHEEAKK